MLRVYLDINDDGAFDSTGIEYVFADIGTSDGIHQGSFMVPAQALTGRQLRLRISTEADLSSNFPSPCQTPEYGQTRDFFLNVSGAMRRPTALFTAADSVTCLGQVDFHDLSLFVPTWWIWSFGDGYTSVEPSPTHTYDTPGTYDVRLIVGNAAGTDTLLKRRLVQFNDTLPVPACIPATQGYCCGYGITRVRLSLVDENKQVLDQLSPNASVGYENFTCSKRIRLIQGKAYQLALTTAIAQAINIWIDANGNGILENSELLVSHTGVLSPIDTILIPTATGAAVGRPVRMRLATASVGAVPASCGPLQGGQAEDYTVLLSVNTLPPHAIASVDTGGGCNPSYVFSQHIANPYTQAIWDFGDGHRDTTLAQSVRYTYTAIGIYTVHLYVQGPGGSDTVELSRAVRYLPSPVPVGCQPTASRTCCGAGILRFSLGSLDAVSEDAASGRAYQDFTCMSSADLVAGKRVPFTITTGGAEGAAQVEAVRIWMDINGDGFFAPSEAVANLPTGLGTRSGSFRVPTPAAYNTPFRLRVRSRLGIFGDTVAPCLEQNDSQAEDYTVVIRPSTTPPIAAFYLRSRFSCNGTVEFTDTSLNADSVVWSFGDGQRFSGRDPVHTYASPGTYTVLQTVYNAYGVDSLRLVNAVEVLANYTIAPPPCRPAPQQPNLQGTSYDIYGLTRVRFVQIDNPTRAGIAEGYKDYSCTQIARMPWDSTAVLTLNTRDYVSGELAAVYIDLDASGTFEDSELLASQPIYLGQLQVPLHFPVTAAVNRPLRMRVLTDFWQGQISSCPRLQYGQAEDYAIILTSDTSQIPQASFSIDNRSACQMTVQFRDSTQGHPTSWLWKFGDGQTSTEQNPVHQYAASGTYSVILIVGSPAGPDSLVSTNLIAVNALSGLTPSDCVPSFTQSPATGPGLRLLKLGPQTFIPNTSRPATGSYQDLTCSQPVLRFLRGDSIEITALLVSQGDKLGVWLDGSANGHYEDDELVAYLTQDALLSRSIKGKFRMPGTVPLNTPMRLRFAAIASSDFFFHSRCLASQGQFVDIAVMAVLAPPVAQFAINPYSCGYEMYIKQQSTGGALSYFWDFGDGQTSTDSLPNGGSHTYTAEGVYTIRLIARNELGSDTIESRFVAVETRNANCFPHYATLHVRSEPVGISVVRMRNISGDTISVPIVGRGGAGVEWNDNSCRGGRISAEQGSVLAIKAELLPISQPFNLSLAIGLDLDGDGYFFSQGEVIFFQPGITVRSLQANVLIPSSSDLGLHLLRVQIADSTGGRISCSSIYDGQAQDFSLYIEQARQAATLTKHRQVIQLTPNPARTEVRLDIGAPPPASATLRLVDALGRLIREQPVTEAATVLPVDDLSPGIYQVLIDMPGYRAVKRLIVER